METWSCAVWKFSLIGLGWVCCWDYPWSRSLLYSATSETHWVMPDMLNHLHSFNYDFNVGETVRGGGGGGGLGDLVRLSPWKGTTSTCFLHKGRRTVWARAWFVWWWRWCWTSGSCQCVTQPVMVVGTEAAAIPPLVKDTMARRRQSAHCGKTKVGEVRPGGRGQVGCGTSSVHRARHLQLDYLSANLFLHFHNENGNFPPLWT